MKKALATGVIILTLAGICMGKGLTGLERVSSVPASDTVLLKAEDSDIVFGDVLDHSGRLIIRGTEGGFSLHGLPESEIRAISNVFGPELSLTGSSPFYLRRQFAEELYGVHRDNLTVDNLLFGKKERGYSVETTISLELSGQIYEWLAELGEPRAAAVVYNFANGDVISEVSYPSFSLEDETEYALKERETGATTKQPAKASPVVDTSAIRMVNQTVQMTWHPCSTMKPILLACALEIEPALEEVRYTCDGSIETPGGTITCLSSHGEEGFREAIGRSCNCYFENLMYNVPREALLEKLSELGFGQSLTSEYLSFYKGSFHADTDADFTASVIGEGSTTISPLQAARIYGAFFQYGGMYEPKVRHDQRPVYRKVFSEQTADLVMHALGYSVSLEDGTCTLLRTDGLGIGGKTGTGSDPENKDLWCIAGLMSDHLPFVIVVTVPSSSDPEASGARVCEPVVKKIIDELRTRGEDILWECGWNPPEEKTIDT